VKGSKGNKRHGDFCTLTETAEGGRVTEDKKDMWNGSFMPVSSLKT
jgi:hypothetical protein